MALPRSTWHRPATGMILGVCHLPSDEQCEKFGCTRSNFPGRQQGRGKWAGLSKLPVTERCPCTAQSGCLWDARATFQSNGNGGYSDTGGMCFAKTVGLPAGSFKYWHCRRHVDCAVIDVPVLKLTASARAFRRYQAHAKHMSAHMLARVCARCPACGRKPWLLFRFICRQPFR